MEKNPPPPGFMPPPPYEAQPPPNYPHPYPPTHVIVNQTIQYGSESQRSTCPYCHENIVTRIETEANSRTHCIALMICLFLCWPCAWMPYCIDSCQSINHYCPHCNAFLGTYNN